MYKKCDGGSFRCTGACAHWCPGLEESRESRWFFGRRTRVEGASQLQNHGGKWLDHGEVEQHRCQAAALASLGGVLVGLG